MRKPTIKEVAARAQVSLKTVSRVINDEPGVHAATREQVLRAVAERFTLAPEREEGERMRRRSVTLAPARGASIIPLTR